MEANAVRLISNAFLLLTALLTAHVEANCQQQDLEPWIDSLMAPARKAGMPASFLIIAENGKPLVRKAYGLANIELDVPAKPEHLFTLASVSKQMVAVAVLQLAATGKLQLKDDIREYFPSFDTHGKLITIEHLLTHTSGIYSETGATGASGKTLFDLAAPHGLLTEDEFLGYVMEHEPFFDPGADWGWNTYGFYMAFMIIEKVSGMPFNEYIRKHLFEPAGMTNSFSKVDGNRTSMLGTKNLISSYYQPDVDGRLVWKDFKRFTPMYFYERYSIATCLDDLVKWDVALREGKLLPSQWLNKAWTPFSLKDGRSTNYGYGWAVSNYHGIRLLAHIGIGTNPICVVHVPERKLYLAYTQFYGSYEQTEITLKKILSHMLHMPYPKMTTERINRSEYPGVYQINRIGLRSTQQLSDIPVYLNVTSSGDTLYIQQTGSERTWLRPVGKDKFLPARSENMWYIFLRDKQGKVNGITTEGTLWTFGPTTTNNRVDFTVARPKTIGPIDSQLLKKYSGVYYLPSLDIYRFIETDGKRLFHRFQNARQELVPLSPHQFIVMSSPDNVFEFTIDETGAQLLTVKGLRTTKFRKVE